jgi:transposase
MAGVVLSEEQVAELRAVVSSRGLPAVVATRARIMLWMAEGRRRKDVAELAGVSLPTVDRWVDRYAEEGLAGLDERKRGGPREQVPSWVPARILALTRASPPSETGLSHWSSRQLAAYLKRTEWPTTRPGTPSGRRWAGPRRSRSSVAWSSTSSGRAVFLRLTVGHTPPVQLIAVSAALVLMPVARHLPALGTLGLLTTILIALVGYERITWQPTAAAR